MRIPSLHITELELIRILQSFPNLAESPKELANFIMNKAKSKSIAHRGILASNDKLLKNTERLKLNTRTNTGLFAELLLLMRRKLKHRAIQLVKPGSADWLILKEISNLANDFCNEFQISKKDGYKAYIEIALSKMQKYSLNKFKMLNQAIYSYYEAKLELDSDKTPDETSKAYNTYITIINNRIGHFYEDYKKNLEKYVCFKKAKDEAFRMKLPINQYITAQFEALEWANGIPDPLQLYGEKAIERARKYCYSHNITLTPKNTVNFTLIKKANERNKNNSK